MAKIRRNVSKEVRHHVHERDEYRWLKCGDREDLTIDHIIPLSKGGTNEVINLQTLCQRCNFFKSNKTKDYRKGVSKKPLKKNEQKIKAGILPPIKQLIVFEEDYPNKEFILHHKYMQGFKIISDLWGIELNTINFHT